MPDDTQRWIGEAIRLAVENASSGAGGPFGAVIVKDGQIVASGTNEVTRACDPTAHAEIVALRRAGAALGTFHLQGCVLYASCEPCPMCLAAAYWAHVDAVFYAGTQQDAAAVGFDDAFLYQELRLPHAERKLPMQRLDHPDALLAFRRWATSQVRVPY